MPGVVGATVPFAGDGVDAVGAVVMPGVVGAPVPCAGDGVDAVGAVATPGVVSVTMPFVGDGVDVVGAVVTPGVVGVTVPFVGDGVDAVGAVVMPGVVGATVLTALGRMHQSSSAHGGMLHSTAKPLSALHGPGAYPHSRAGPHTAPAVSQPLCGGSASPEPEFSNPKHSSFTDVATRQTLLERDSSCVPSLRRTGSASRTRPATR